MPALGPPVSQRTATRARRKDYERRQANLRRPAPTPRPTPRPAPTRPTTKIGQEVARARTQEMARKTAAAVRTRVPARPTPLRPTPTATQRPLAQERYYKSQGKAIAEHAVTDPALREIEKYVAQTPVQKRQQLAQIKAKPVNQQSLGEYNIVRLHAGRHRSDIKMLKSTHFLPRVRYGYTPKATKYNIVQPTKQQREGKALEAKKLARMYSRPGSAEHRALVGKLMVPGAIEAFKTDKARKEAAHLSPVLTAFEQTLRPVHAVAGGIHYGLKGKNIATGVKRGAALKDRVLFSDVLGDLGLKKGALRSILGTTLDIGLDPTTYAGFGVGSVAIKGARKAAEEAAAKAYAQSLSNLAGKELGGREAKELARRQARKIYAQSFEKHMRAAKPEHHTRGLDIRITGGKTARRVGRAIKRKTGIGTKGVLAPTTRFTAHQGRLIQKVARPLTEKTKEARGTLRQGYSEVIGPGRAGRTVGGEEGGVYAGPASKTEHLLTKALQREARSEGEREARFFANRARSILNRATPDEERAIVDALEARGRGAYRVRGRRAAQKGIQDSAKLPLRNILTSGQKRLLPNVNPFEVRRRIKSSRDPERVAKIANQLESDLKYAERIGTRSGALSSRIGAKRLTPSELKLATTAQRAPRATEALERELDTARVETRAARQKLEQQQASVEAATTRSQKRHRQAKVKKLEDDLRATQQRSDNLSGRIRGAHKQTVARGRAARDLRTARRERFRGVEVPEVTADVAGAQARVRGAKATAAEAETARGGAQIAVTKGNKAEQAPTLSRLTSHLEKKGAPGVAREQGIDRATFEATGQKLPRSDVHVFVKRNEKGKIVGALEVYAPYPKMDAKGDPLKRGGKTQWDVKTSSVAVAPSARRQGVATELMQRALDEGVDVLHPTGESFTKAGAGLVSKMRGKRLGERATEAQARAAQTERRLAQVVQHRGRQTKAAQAALRRQEEIGPPEAAGYFPRVRSQKGISLDEMAAELGPRLEIPIKESEGVRRPRGGPLQQRKQRATRAYYRGQAPEALAKTEEGIVPTMAIYGGALATRTAQANLNRKLFAEAGMKVPRTLGPAQIKGLKDRGYSVYHLDRGSLDPLDWSDDLKEITAAASGATAAGGQYKVLPNQLVRDVYARGPAGRPELAVKALHRATGAWKGFALKTPSYLTRNFFGDLYNAWGHEGTVRILTSTVQGQQALRQLTKYDKALRTFEKQVPKSQRSIPLTKGQRDEISQALGYDVGAKIPARQAALLAEKFGAIRQGRLVEVNEARRAGQPKARRQGAWTTVSQHVEDSVRMGSFLSALHRGMSPREAAQKVADVHFDYGDLSSFEKNILRQIFPFYTFTARNVPLQTKMFFQRPGRVGAVAKTREESKRYAGVQGGAEKGLDPYEALQAGFFYKTGKGKDTRKGTLSFGSPFIDLSTAGALAQSAAEMSPSPAAAEAYRRATGLAHPGKLALELPLGVSFFYKDKIRKADQGQGPRELAPGWAVKLAAAFPAFGKLNGIGPFRDEKTGETGMGWKRNVGYFWRSTLPGPAGAISRAPGLGVPGVNARGMSPVEQALTIGGIRTKRYTAKGAELQSKFREKSQIRDQMQDLGDSPHPREKDEKGRPYPIDKDHPTPEWTRLNERRKVVERRIKALQGKTKPGGGGSGLDLGIDVGSTTDLGLDLDLDSLGLK